MLIWVSIASGILGHSAACTVALTGTQFVGLANDTWRIAQPRTVRLIDKGALLVAANRR